MQGPVLRAGLGGRLARSIARRPWWWLLGGLASALLAVLPATRLRPEVDLAALLPEGSAAAEDYRVFLETFGGLEKVFVVISARAGEPVGEGELLEAAWRFEELLRESSLVSGVRSGGTAEDEEFLLRWVVPRMALLLDDGAELLSRRASPEGLREAAARLHASAQVPGGEIRLRLASRDPLGLSQELLARAGGEAGLPVEPMSGAFLSADGDTTLLIVQPRVSEIDSSGGRALRALLEQAWATVGGELDVSGIDWLATGGPLYAAADEELIRRDMIRTVGTSVAGCLAVLILAFVGWATAAATTVTLAVAAAWLAGALALVSGSISALSLGFAAVLVGLGIDYAIHGATRYREAREEGAPPAAALESAFARSGAAIAASAATTAGAFGVLFFAHFRPLFEIGLVVALGITSVAVATATVGAASLVLIDQRWPGALGSGRSAKGSFLWRALGAGPAAVANAAARRPVLVLALAVALSAASLLGLRSLSLDSDPRSLRPEGHPAIAAEERLVSEFGLGFETATAVITGATLDAALEHSAAAATLLRDRLGAGAAVDAPSDWLASSRFARERLGAIAALDLGGVAADLEAALRAENLSPRYFEPGIRALDRLVAGEDPGAPPRAQWPDWLREQVAVDGDRTAVALRVRLADDSAALLADPELARALGEVAPGASLASSARLGEELRQLAVLDAERLVELALLAVAILVALSFRGSPRWAILAVTPVVGGTLWTFGLWGFAVGRCDLMSLAVAPILLGIGIDDGLHATHGAAASGSLREGVASAGRAMTLTTLTTVVGFGSLTVSSIPGLRQAGLLIALGVALCLAATLVVLPAIGALVERRTG
jgi:predicted RND superfamily exporter protein